LTDSPFEVWQLLGRSVRVETSAEIVAKKMWHRGDRVSARDIFDLSLVIEREPDALIAVSQHLVRHKTEFLAQLQSRSAILKLQFEAIDRLNYQPSYEEASHRVADFLRAL
jgi:predicted nucleotidyltransferase component of viral defense system